MTSNFAPHESDIKKAQDAGAIGVIFIRKGNFPPGFSMHLVDGSDRKRLTIPVMEVIYPKTTNVDEIAEGSYVSLHASVNRHKQASETRFQLIFNLIQSFGELGIIILGLYRVWQFWFVEGVHAFSVAPICCLLEVIGASLRLAYTCVDPFFTYRMMPEHASIVLITVSMPFSESAGMLLTFFWAESLSRHHVRAVPFISRYKSVTFVGIAVLFVIEIICVVIRVVAHRVGPASIYISLALSLVVSVVLIVCYIATAVAIMRRLEELNIRRSGRGTIRTLTTRIAISSAGYFLFICGLISFAIFSQYVLGRGVTLNIAFMGLNLAAIMQVYALRPVHRPNSSRSRSNGSKPSQSNSNGASDRGLESFPA